MQAEVFKLCPLVSENYYIPLIICCPLMIPLIFLSWSERRISFISEGNNNKFSTVSTRSLTISNGSLEGLLMLT